MIQRYVEVHKHVFTIQCNTKSAPSVIVAEELEVLTELLELLKPFENATKIVSGEKYVTASKVIPIIFEIKSKLQEHIPRTSECVALKQGLISQFDQRFKSKEHVSLLAQTTILDPRFKKVPFQDRVACSRAQQMIAVLSF